MSLVNEFLHNIVDFTLLKIVYVDSSFNSEVVASHDCWLSILAFSHNEGEVGVFAFDVNIVVLDIVPIKM